MARMHTPLTPEELHAYKHIVKGLNEYLTRMRVYAKYGRQPEVIAEADKAFAYLSGVADLSLYSGMYVGWLYRQLMKQINRERRACKAACEKQFEDCLEELYD